MAFFTEGFIKQWWDRSYEASIKNRSNEQQKKEAAKKAEEHAKNDESHLKEHGLIMKKEFDRCFVICKDCFRSNRKFGYAATFRPSEYINYYVYDKNDFIRLGYVSLEEYYKTDDDKVWEADKENFKKLLDKISKKINQQIKEEKMEGISFEFGPQMFGMVNFILESTKPKEEKKDEDPKKGDK